MFYQERLGYSELKKKAREIRTEVIRMLEHAGSGHSGGSLSEADILSVLFFNAMNHDPKNPAWDERDRFILSKGHACPALYVTYALCGYLPKEELLTFNMPGSRLQNHPGRQELPILEASTGSLGQGISIAVGMALAARLDDKSHSVYCLMGDGEQQEGEVWEAAMCASQLKLDNLCAIIDANKVQLSGPTGSIVNVEPLKKKYESFGWKTITVNGHNIWHLLWAFRMFRVNKERSNKPFAIIARTVKGKGVSFMENSAEWHGKAPNHEQAKQALAELAAKKEFLTFEFRGDDEGAARQKSGKTLLEKEKPAKEAAKKNDGGKTSADMLIEKIHEAADTPAKDGKAQHEESKKENSEEEHPLA